MRLVLVTTIEAPAKIICLKLATTTHPFPLFQCLPIQKASQNNEMEQEWENIVTFLELSRGFIEN